MSDLKIVNLYENSEQKHKADFKDNLRSSLHVDTLYDKVDTDYEWLDLMEDTTRYLDNILRNPNRFIVNEEEIVKIELARRITVESIRHLSKHTNFIQEINEQDEVKPSKILNINKDESFDTYENRLIFTLIQRMRDFIQIKKGLSIEPFLKDSKKMEYQAKSIIGKEKINMSLIIDSKIDTKPNGPDTYNEIDSRISRLESDISMLMNTDVYKDLARKHVAKVIPPIKKTNVILKNTNFQYAMKLWDYLQNNVATPPKRTKENKSFEDSGVLKEYVNDTFLLSYVALSTLSKKEDKSREKEMVVEELTNNLIERIVELNVDMSEDKLKEIVGDKILIARNKKIASLSEIQNAFSRQIKIYLEKIEGFKFEGDI